jgi:hypothetical protein
LSYFGGVKLQYILDISAEAHFSGRSRAEPPAVRKFPWKLQDGLKTDRPLPAAGVLSSLTANLCFISNDEVDMFRKHDSSTTSVGYE